MATSYTVSGGIQPYSVSVSAFPVSGEPTVLIQSQDVTGFDLSFDENIKNFVVKCDDYDSLTVFKHISMAPKETFQLISSSPSAGEISSDVLYDAEGTNGSWPGLKLTFNSRPCIEDIIFFGKLEYQYIDPYAREGDAELWNPNHFSVSGVQGEENSIFVQVTSGGTSDNWSLETQNRFSFPANLVRSFSGVPAVSGTTKFEPAKYFNFSPTLYSESYWNADPILLSINTPIMSGIITSVDTTAVAENIVMRVGMEDPNGNSIPSEFTGGQVVPVSASLGVGGFAIEVRPVSGDWPEGKWLLDLNYDISKKIKGVVEIVDYYNGNTIFDPSYGIGLYFSQTDHWFGDIFIL